MRNFLWTGSTINRKLVQVSWNLCCHLNKEGGLDIKNLQLLNEAIFSKLAWKMLSSLEYPIYVLHARFLSPSGIPRYVYFRSSV